MEYAPNAVSAEQVPFTEAAGKAIAKVRSILPSSIRTELDKIEDRVAIKLAAIAEGLEELRMAVENVVASPRTVPDDAQQAKKHCNRVRQLYQLQLAELFQGEVDVEMFKRRELLRRIDVVALRMGEAADALQDGVLKRRH